MLLAKKLAHQRSENGEMQPAVHDSAWPLKQLCLAIGWRSGVSVPADAAAESIRKLKKIGGAKLKAASILQQRKRKAKMQALKAADGRRNSKRS